MLHRGLQRGLQARVLCTPASPQRLLARGGPMAAAAPSSGGPQRHAATFGTPAPPPLPQLAPRYGFSSSSNNRMLALAAAPIGAAVAAASLPSGAVSFLALALLAAAGLVVALLDALRKSEPPQLTHADTPFLRAMLAACPTLRAVYRATPLLTNGHVETILVAKLRGAPGVEYRREIVAMPDGGVVAVDWEHLADGEDALPPDAPVLILFPGLTGGSGDSYVQHCVRAARRAGVRAAVFNSRGTADSPVTTPQFYSASYTDDTRRVVAHVQKAHPRAPLLAAGWSLGANILVTYLGEEGGATPLRAAVSMCNPFDLTLSNEAIHSGFNVVYNRNLAASLKRIFAKHAPLWRGYKGPAQPGRVPDVSTIREFDEAITVHSFDWEDVDAYYAGSSSCKRIPDVAVPLLCLQALDDPIAPAAAIPCDAIAANANCLLAVTPCGGHLGWASGPGAPFGAPWTDAAVFEWLRAVLAWQQAHGAGSVAPAAAAAGSRAAVAADAQRPRGGNGGDDDGDDAGGSNGGGAGAVAGAAAAPPRAPVRVGVAAGGSSSSISSSNATRMERTAAAAAARTNERLDAERLAALRWAF